MPKVINYFKVTNYRYSGIPLCVPSALWCSVHDTLCGTVRYIITGVRVVEFKDGTKISFDFPDDRWGNVFWSVCTRLNHSFPSIPLTPPPPPPFLHSSLTPFPLCPFPRPPSQCAWCACARAMGGGARG
jgi:hypothetical protein